jgi:hypothetical protein
VQRDGVEKDRALQWMGVDSHNIRTYVKEAGMQNFQEEISSWRRVFKLMDQLTLSEEDDTPHNQPVATPPSGSSATTARVENDHKESH